MEAVQKAEELQPDSILLDVNLPKMHGFEVAKENRRLAPPARFSSSARSPRRISYERRSVWAPKVTFTRYLPRPTCSRDRRRTRGQRFVSRSLALTEPNVAPAPRRHEIPFCPAEEAIVEGFTRCVAAALNAGDAAIALVTEPHRTELLQELRTQGVDIDGAIERGTCLSFDADVTRLRPILEAIMWACGRGHSRERHPRSLFAGNVRDAYGPQAERRRRSTRTTLWRTGA